MSALIGAGIGLAYGSMPELIMGAVPSQDGFRLIMAIGAAAALTALAIAAFIPGGRDNGTSAGHGRERASSAA